MVAANDYANDYDCLTPGARALLARDSHPSFIAGREVSAADGATLPVIDPSSGCEVTRIADATPAEVDAAVAAAARALASDAWGQMRPSRRAALMHALADAIERESETLAQVETVNSGKLIGNTRLFDVAFSAQTLRTMAGWATALHGQTMDLSVPYLPDQRFLGETRRFPVGVVAAITPWNVPLNQAVWKLAPVLATGCTLVLKPAEQTALTALRLAQLAQEVGIPDGVINVVVGSGQRAGAALVAHPGIDKISFTGSTPVGRAIAMQAAARFLPVNLELGGKSAVIIAPDADPDRAIMGAAWAIFGNHGQNCCAGSRLLVHASLYDRVVAGVADIARDIVLGPGLDPASTMGPLVSHAHRNRVAAHVEAARAAGAQVLDNAVPQAPGAWFSPTVIAGLDPGHPTVQEEIFGPVVCAFAWRTQEEALALANGTAFALGASVWTDSMATWQWFFQRLDAGTVWHNTHNVLDLALPFGGRRDSGIGHELGREGVLSHTRIKAAVLHQTA